MSESIITVADLEALSRQIAAGHFAETPGYRSTANQVFFFTLVWAVKRKVAFQQRENRLVGLTADAAQERARQVADHLNEWGPAVAKLKQREEIEWQLLRLQMEKAVSHYRHPYKEDAVQEGLMAVLGVLDKMFDEQTLETTADIVALVVNARQGLSNIYDFGSPFYAFAKRIARNKFLTQMRRNQRKPVYPLPTEKEQESALISGSSFSVAEEEEAAQVHATLLRLKIDLARLLGVIRDDLTPKPRQVVLHTLAARPQFWRALTVTELAAPDDLPSHPGLSNDADIAKALGMSENSVRVHRSHAKKRVRGVDPILALLLERLMARRA